jgi:hypothetical protein
MDHSQWMWGVVVAVVVAVVISLRWAVADIVLDEFGRLTDWLTRVRRTDTQGREETTRAHAEQREP